MDWLNYHHLYYFWSVVKEGGVSAAARKLRLAQPTVSGQLKALEDSFGEKLFTRSGRKLVLTEVGNVVYRYADEIFSLGRELQDAVKDRPTGRPLRLTVGVSDAVPKLIAFRLLEPALHLGQKIRITVNEGPADRLLAALATHAYDLVIADAPLGSGSTVRAFSHLLGETAISFFAAKGLAGRLAKGFPQSLSGAPLLMPADNSALERSLSRWLEQNGLRPEVVGDFQDNALLQTFGQAGLGVFPAPTAIEEQVRLQYGVEVVGRVDELRDRFYAITVDRRIKHPAVVAISEAARTALFASSGRGASNPPGQP